MEEEEPVAILPQAQMHPGRSQETLRGYGMAFGILYDVWEPTT